MIAWHQKYRPVRFPRQSGGGESVGLAEVLVLLMRDRLDLERRVVDGEGLAGGLAELVGAPADADRLEGLVGDRHVRGQAGQAAGDRPGMQVVDVDHAGNIGQVASYV